MARAPTRGAWVPNSRGASGGGPLSVIRWDDEMALVPSSFLLLLVRHLLLLARHLLLLVSPRISSRASH